MIATMFLKTIKSRLYGEHRWLRAWDDEAKKAELWNVIANLADEIRFHNFEVEDTYLTFSRFGVGICASKPYSTGKIIATIKPWDFDVFRKSWNNAGYLSYEEQDKALTPLVEDVFQQVYGRHE
jgi:hypothetical protein